VRAQSASQKFDLPAGSVLVFDKDVPHQFTAVKDSAFVMVIAWPAAD
jgi:quercetin dioxygenase-like cupin family protein